MKNYADLTYHTQQPHSIKCQFFTELKPTWEITITLDALTGYGFCMFRFITRGIYTNMNSPMRGPAVKKSSSKAGDNYHRLILPFYPKPKLLKYTLLLPGSA